MKRFLSKLAALTLLGLTSAHADGPPPYLVNTLPEHAVGEILTGYGKLQGEGSVLDPRVRELIAVAVAAQIPCSYCVYAHVQNAKANGATDAELREAAAVAGFVRLWSTVLHAGAYDLDTFKAEHDAFLAGK